MQRGRGTGAGTIRITPRETQALRGCCEGKTTSEVAREMVIAEDTVRKHLKAAYRKLGVHGRVEAVLMFQRLRLAGDE